MAAFGKKPPLSQSPGIFPAELLIEPYITQMDYRRDDVFLICSDGLTDMIPEQEAEAVLQRNTIHVAAQQLMDKALANGGKDNITVVVSEIERAFAWSSLLKRKNRQGCRRFK